MTVTLPPELAKFITEQVNSGRYTSPDQAVEAGVARLILDPITDELDAEDLAAIEESETQIARGQDLDWKEVFAQLRKQYFNE